MSTVATLSPEVKQSLDKVKKDKLFPFVKGLHKDAKYFDPDDSKTDQDVLDSVLTEKEFKSTREELVLVFSLLRDLVAGANNISEFVLNAEQKQQNTEKILNENLDKIAEHTDKLYQPLAELDLYYQNTSLDKLENITLIALNEDLWNDDPDDEIFQAFSGEVGERAKQIDKSNNVGYIVMPKFPGQGLLSRLADVAFRSKATLVVGYRDLPDVESTMDFMERDQIGGTEAKWGNVVIVSNSALTDEGKRLSPAAALGGRMQVNLLSQPVAGLTSGSLVLKDKGLRYNVNQEELALFKKNGVVPMVNAFQSDMSYGTWTAFKGDNIELQHYAVVRVLNWISRSLCHHLNKCTHEIATNKRMNRINTQVVSFLKQLEKFNIIRKGEVKTFRLDDKMPDTVYIDLAIQPLYAVRLFAVTIEAKKGADAEAETSQ